MYSLYHSWKPPSGAKIQQVRHHRAAYWEHLKEQATKSSWRAQVEQYALLSCNITLTTLAQSLSHYSYNTTFQHFSTRDLGYSLAHCPQCLTPSLQYFGHVSPAISLSFSETSQQSVLYSSTSQTRCSQLHLNVLVGSLGYQQLKLSLDRM